MKNAWIVIISIFVGTISAVLAFIISFQYVHQLQTLKVDHQYQIELKEYYKAKFESAKNQLGAFYMEDKNEQPTKTE